MSDKCEWYRSPEDDEYQSDWGHGFYFIDGTFSEQAGSKFCPYCSLEIEPVEPVECPVCHWEMDAKEGCTNTHATVEKGEAQVGTSLDAYMADGTADLRALLPATVVVTWPVCYLSIIRTVSMLERNS